MVIVLTLILTAGIAIWAAFQYIKHQSRESELLQKLEENRGHLRDLYARFDGIIALLDGFYEVQFENSALDARHVVGKKISDFCCQSLKCSAVSLMLFDKESQELHILAATGISDRTIMSTRVKSGEGVAGRVLESGKPIVVDNIDTDVRFVKKAGVEYRSKSMVSYPVMVKNQVIGVLNLHAEEPHRQLDDRDMRLLNLISRQCAFTLENIDLQDNLQKFYLEMVEIFAHALEMKEHVTADPTVHTRSRNYARKISEELDLPESIIRHVEFASLIHGIGKMGVDDRILRKPERLTSEEYDQIKKHPEIGHKMLAGVRFLFPVSSMILYHQERWDGKGYPAGLRGEEIPLGARIVSVINAYMAMGTERPYRKVLTREESIRELRNGAGTQFDPKVVEAFVKILERENSSEHKNRTGSPGTVSGFSEHSGHREGTGASS